MENIGTALAAGERNTWAQSPVTHSMNCRSAPGFVVSLIAAATMACTDPAEPQPDPGAAAQIGAAEPLPAPLPPPTEAAPRFVGLWAASAEGCAEPAWRFEAQGVSTPGEVSCTFQNVSLTDNGYDVAAICVAQAPPEQHRIQLYFAESAEAMMVSGGPWSAPIALVYCGELSSG